MAYAQEMKNLVAEIKTGHQDRTQYVKDVKEETARLMEGHGAWIKDNKKNVADLLGQYAKEMKEMAKDLKDFLAKSEDTRKKDFDVMIKAIQARVRDIKKDTADLMKDIRVDIGAIRKTVGALLADYKAERKEAAGYWARLGAREEAAPAIKKASAVPKRGGRRKKK